MCASIFTKHFSYPSMTTASGKRIFVITVSVFCLTTIILASLIPTNRTSEVRTALLQTIRKSSFSLLKRFGTPMATSKLAPIKHHGTENYNWSPKAVILISQTKSGSSFVGEIFNQRKGVAYFFEPLYPFGVCPNVNRVDVMDYLLEILQGNVVGSTKIYARVLSQLNPKHSNVHNIRSKICATNAFCYPACIKCAKFLSRDAKICRLHSFVQDCPVPFNLTTLTELVRQSQLVALKVVRICKPEWIETLLSKLPNVKILHLVRDPRAVLSAKRIVIEDSDDTAQSRKAMEDICTQLTTLVEYSDRKHFDTNRYMRIRHEDIATDPLTWTQNIYNFVNLTTSNHVLRWLKTVAARPSSSAMLHKSSRRPIDTVFLWRKKLPFWATNLMQNYCKRSMELLGYLKLSNYEQQRNFNISHFVSLAS